MSEIRTEIDGSIGWLVIDAPNKLNSLNETMWTAIPEAVAKLDADEDVRIIVLRGAGEKAFSAGADISEFDTVRAGDKAKHYNMSNNHAFDALQGAVKPTIAMVHGFCLGGGMLLAFSADMIIASQEASFSLPPAKLGLGFDIHWISPILKALPPHFVKEMFYTAERYSSADLHKFGALNKVVPSGDLIECTRSLAETIAANAPLSIQNVKSAIHALARNDHHLDLEAHAALMARCLESADYIEGRAAFKERRKPHFLGK